MTTPLYKLNPIHERTEPDYYVCDCVEQCADICPRPMPVFKPIDRRDVLALLDRITQLERERDEARAEVERLKVVDKLLAESEEANETYKERNNHDNT